MKRILKMSPGLYVDLESGYCSRFETILEDKNKDRLSEAPLRVFNYLVEHKETLCKNEVLEGLFDRNTSADKTPRIRGYINKIRTVFSGIDPYFKSDEGKEFITSRYEQGYVFHLPKGGELIFVSSPLDSLHQLDPVYLGTQKKYAQKNAETIEKHFRQMKSDWDNTFQAVLLGLDVQGAAQWKVLNTLEKYVLEADCREGITALTSRGADGKTVLLAQFAKRCAENHPNWNLYDLNMAQTELSFDAIDAVIKHLRQNGIGNIKKNILLIDAPDLMSASFRNLLLKLQEERIEYLHVLFTCRLSELVMAFHDSPDSEKYVPVRTFLITCEEENERNALYGTDINLLADIAKQMSGFYVPEKLRKEVLRSAAVSEFQKAAGWTDEKLNPLLNDLECSKKSFVELYLDLFCRAAGDSDGMDKSIIEDHNCKGSLPWDDWERLFRNADQFCRKQKLSAVFPYVMAFLKYKLPVTAAFLYSLTEYTSVTALRDLLACCDNEWFYFENDKIRIRHKSVLDAYFLLHPANSAQTSFETLLQGNWMDTDTLLHFVNHFFEKIMYTDPAGIPGPLNLHSLLLTLMKSQESMRLLADNDMADIPEIAYLWLEYGPEFYESDLSGMKRAFAASLDRVLASTDKEITRLMYWKDMLLLATYYFDDLPEWLKEFYDAQTHENQSGLMNVLEEEYTSGGRYRGIPWQKRMRHYINQLRERESDQKGTNDQNDEQIFMSGLLSRHPELHAIQILESQLIEMMNSTERVPGKMEQLTDIIFAQYKSAYETANKQKDKELLMSVLIKWAYLYYGILKYEDSFKLIRLAQREIPDKQEGAYWIYYMEGVLREDCGVPEYGLRNPFYSLKEAEAAYLRAFKLYMKYGDQNQNEPFILILKGLAALYYIQGDERSEKEVYRMIEERVPASMIRDEIHAEAKTEGEPGLDDDIIIKIGDDT